MAEPNGIPRKFSNAQEDTASYGKRSNQHPNGGEATLLEVPTSKMPRNLTAGRVESTRLVPPTDKMPRYVGGKTPRDPVIR